MVFPKFEIQEVLKQEQRDLTLSFAKTPRGRKPRPRNIVTGPWAQPTRPSLSLYRGVSILRTPTLVKFYSRLHGAEWVSEVSVRRFRRGSTHLKHLKQCAGGVQMF
jgi:hypothetical protein